MSQTGPPKKYEYVPFAVMEQQQSSTLNPTTLPSSPTTPTHSTPHPPSSGPSTVANETVTNGTLSPDSGVASPIPPLAPESTDRPKPVPKPRANYQTVSLTAKPTAGDTSSHDSPAKPKLPPVAQKPKNYVPTFLKEVPQSVPRSEAVGGGAVEQAPEGTSEQSEKEGAEVSVPPSTALVKPPTSKQGMKLEDEAESNSPATEPPPPLPNRINECFQKQASLDTNPVKPLPPKPRPRAKTVPGMSSMPSPAELNWRPTGEKMTLAQLAETQSDKFPIKIHLLDGYYGQTNRFTLSASDIFNVHFTKHTKVMTTRDSVGTVYTIPLNSAIKFGIIYDPDREGTPGAVKTPTQKRKGNKKPEQETNTVFETVADLLALKTLPKVVCASCTSFGGKGDKLTVKRDEILIIKGVYKPALKHKKALKCYSIQAECKKLLPADCRGNFSIAPERTQIHVLEFANKLKNALPCQAMMFLSSESDYESPVFRNIPKALFKKPITLINVTMEVALAATSPAIVAGTADPPEERYEVTPQEKASRVSQLLEIPLDSHLGELEAEILEAPSEKETERLYMNTQVILAEYNPRHYMVLLDKGSDKINDAQSVFYMAVRSDLGKAGVELRTSQAVYDRVESKKTNKETDGYETVGSGDTKQREATESVGSGKKKGGKRAAYEISWSGKIKEEKGAATKGSTGKGSASKNQPLMQLKEEDYNSDSSDDHVYEMIDDEAREMFKASGSAAGSPLHSSPVSLLSPKHRQTFSPPPQQWLHEQYQPQPTATQLPSQVPFAPYPGLSAQPPLSSYVHMFPGGQPTPGAVPLMPGPDTAAVDYTSVPPDIIAANKQFVRNMTLATVSECTTEKYM